MVCFSLSEMKLLDILSCLMMDDTYKGRGKYHSKVSHFPCQPGWTGVRAAQDGSRKLTLSSADKNKANKTVKSCVVTLL